MTRTRRYALWAVLLLAGAWPRSTAAQAGRAASAPDSVAALINNLRAAVRAHPDSYELVLAAGRLMGRHADEQSSHWEERVEARNMLDHAVRLRPQDPRARLEFGMLQRKQHEQIDGLRSLKKAEDLASHNDSILSPSERSDMHLHMALIYEVWWEDWANLYFVADNILSGTLVCKDSRYFGLISVNFHCHYKFVEAVKHFHLMEDLKEDDRAAMVHHFAAAVDADSTRVLPMLRLLRWLADWGKWDEYLTRAQGFAQRRPNDPEVLLFLGLGFHEVGQSKRADSVFNRALALASGDLKATLTDITPVISSQLRGQVSALPAAERAALTDAYWAAWDPLYLTPENERLAEHFSRVAYADLAFSSPTSGQAGRMSDKGQLWISFGRPDRIRSIGFSLGGRTDFWDYGDSIPNLVFSHMLTYRGAMSMGYEAEEQILLKPYRPTHPRFIGTIPFQPVRFRDADGRTELNVYARLPLDSLSGPDTIHTGFFAHTLRPWQAVVAGRGTVPATARTNTGHFLAHLAPGSYAISVEATGNDRAATARDSIVIPTRGPALELSDLLFADRIEPRGPTPRARSDLAIDGSPTLEFKAANPVGVVWEVYGLPADSTGTAHYHVQLEVRDARGGLIRALRTLTLQGNARETTLSWDTERALTLNEAALEFTSLTMADAKPGQYRLLITVTDRITNARATTERQFTIVP